MRIPAQRARTAAVINAAEQRRPRPASYMLWQAAQQANHCAEQKSRHPRLLNGQAAGRTSRAGGGLVGAG